jgi:hypothetical protein
LTAVRGTEVVPVAVGVPAMVAVPFPLSVKVRPAGRATDSPREGAG